MIKVMISGSNGFVGSNLKKYLLRKNYLTSSFDRNDIKNILDDNNYLNSKLLIKKLSKVAIFIHCAGIAHKPINKHDKKYIKELNINLTKKIYSLCIKCRVNKFIFISSSKVMGECSLNNEKFNESCIPIPNDYYALSKLKAENILQEIDNEFSTKLIILRPPIIYGPGVKGNFLTLIKGIYKGYPIPIVKNNKTRSFLSINNFNSIINKCIKEDNINKIMYLISDDNDISIEELICRIAECLGKKPRIIYIPNFVVEKIIKIIFKRIYFKIYSSFNLDMEKFKDFYNWQSLKDDNSLKDTVNNYLSHARK